MPNRQCHAVFYYHTARTNRTMHRRRAAISTQRKETDLQARICRRHPKARR